MRLPFSPEDFLHLFVRYNETVWPAQWLLAALALIVVVLATRRTAGAARAAVLRP